MLLNHVFFRSILYGVICLLSYQLLFFLSPEPDLSPKGIILLHPLHERIAPSNPDRIEFLPIIPHHSKAIAWINIEKAITDPVFIASAAKQAREWAASVGANALVALVQGQTDQSGPSRYPLFVFKALAVKI